MHPSLMEQVKRIMELTKENDLFRHKVRVLQNRNVNRKIKKKEGFFFYKQMWKVLWTKRKRPVLNYLSYVEKLQNKIDFLSSDQGCDI